MAELEKYYTPDIEDFSINSEVLVDDLGNYKSDCREDIPFVANVTQITNYPVVWVKSTKTGNQYEIYPDQIKIKYLDQEDIEACGWSLETADDYFKRFIINTDASYTDKNINRWNLRLENSHRILIEQQRHTRFLGTIKNKSELARLMRQLEIPNSLV